MILVEGKDFIGGLGQLPTSLRLVVLLLDLFFCNGYCVSFKARQGAELTRVCREGGWAGSAKNSRSQTKQRRATVG